MLLNVLQRGSALRTIGSGVLGIVAAATLSGGAATAATLQTLYSFCSKPNCTDGNRPIAGLVEDPSGALYGNTLFGGDAKQGVIFRLTPRGGGYHQRTLHSFCSRSSCADGAYPVSNLIVDTAGNLYGLIQAGGLHQGGKAVELIPNSDRTRYRLVTLYDFCAQPYCLDGTEPDGALTYAGQQAGAPYDGTSPLYGTTVHGGSGGVAFELTFVQGRTKRRERILYYFCTQSQCSDGGGPRGAIVDSSGDLLGTTGGGGLGNAGVVFELSPKGRDFIDTTLYKFCSLAHCADGSDPIGPLAQDADGNLFGTTNLGGGGSGVVFEVVPNGTASQETVLHSFCSEGSNCTDGGAPEGGLIIDASGNLFGTATSGGEFGNGGTIFEISSGVYRVLYSFCEQANCTDGNEPFDTLILNSSGDLLGTTGAGGEFDSGTVFMLVP
ncbi:MAG TPA: choice-of-anchor tandem repeat GloVer-containing protein [Rhizomicrobium sp.]|jgi:uncharacterized repeat protein (TIGR03803 family)